MFTSINKKWRQLSSIGAIWLCDLDRTNYNIIFGRFEEIGLLHVMSVFHWLCKFGLDVLLGIDAKIIQTQLVHRIKLIYKFTKFMEDFRRMF